MDKLTFSQLLEEVQTIPLSESRIQQCNLQEFVISTHFITELHLIFQKFFGEQFKAPGELPSLAEKRRAAVLGGIRPEQTLYYLEQDGISNCAMIWPWADGTRCTVKIAQQSGI